jgi:hypothetical protein
MNRFDAMISRFEAVKFAPGHRFTFNGNEMSKPFTVLSKESDYYTACLEDKRKVS